MTARSGYLNEVYVAGRLDVTKWQNVARWSEKKFGSLHVHEVITGQLEKLSHFGVTGEEPYEKEVA
jgi:hypothetical protein